MLWVWPEKKIVFLRMDISGVGCRSLCFWQVPQELHHFYTIGLKNTGQVHIIILCGFLSVKIGSLFESCWVFFFSFLMARPVAYGTLARDWIRATTATYTLHHSCGSTRSFNALYLDRDWTCVLVLQRCHQSHCAPVGTPAGLLCAYIYTHIHFVSLRSVRIFLCL